MAGPWDVSAGETALRLGLAAVFGGLVGAEREINGHDAGFRTHLLVALGAALFGLISVGAFGHFITSRNATDISYDPSRVASYVAAGVGFLGAGSILKGNERIHGLTTAASLWVVAAIGLASGIGFWSAALVGTGIAIVALVAGWPLDLIQERRRRERDELDGPD